MHASAFPFCQDASYIDVLTSADLLPLLFNPLKFDVLIFCNKPHFVLVGSLLVEHSRSEEVHKASHGVQCELAMILSIVPVVLVEEMRCKAEG
jgi:hypothetical protein